MKKLKLAGIIAATMLALGVAKKDANALSIDYLSMNSGGLTGEILNDDEMGPYTQINMGIAIDDIRYIQSGTSPLNYWSMNSTQTGINTALLSFTPLGGINLGEGQAGTFGYTINDALFEAEHGGQSYDNWVNALTQMELAVSGIGPEINSSDFYTVGTPDTTGGTPVPEPNTMILFGAGLLGLAGFARRKQEKIIDGVAKEGKEYFTGASTPYNLNK